LLGSTLQEHLFLGGPRLSAKVGKFRPFAEAIAGAVHIHEQTSIISFSDTNFAYAVGGGLDYRVSKRFGWRVQVDALQTHDFSTWHSNLRASSGIVIHF
jgi:opacity protein-like surface antigen